MHYQLKKHLNHLVILDDMMVDVVNDSSMTKIFTERSHHLKIIFMTQNIFHPGKKDRTISLNDYYMVLFKNPRDRKQIQTLARQCILIVPNIFRQV